MTQAPARSSTSELAASYAACQTIARHAARNFYYSFWTLPAAQRQAMCALYAFLRATDDVGDNPAPVAERQQALDAWRGKLHRALQGHPEPPLFPALVDTVERYRIPVEYLEAVLDGVQMDLAGQQYATFEELAAYCHRVASVVGLACIHIWGFDQNPAALEPARQLGIAFQMTNILRDVGEDLATGRVYLPRTELEQFGVTVEQLQRREVTPSFRELMQFQIDRTRRLYRQGLELAQWLAPTALPTLQIMTGIYGGLLTQIERSPEAVLSRRVRLSSWHKCGIALGALVWRPTPASMVAQWERR